MPAGAFEIVPDQAAIDTFTGQPHYFAHVAPVARRLGLTVQVGARIADTASYPDLRIEPYAAGPARPARRHDTALVMGPADIREAVRFGWKRIAYLCHGVGQDYNRLLAAAAPGESIPWDRVEVVLLPSEFAGERFEPLCPSAEKVVVGQPKLDAYAALEPPSGRVVALSFRWGHKRAPEASGAFDHYSDDLGALRAYLAAHGVQVLGHGHPRIFDDLAPVYRAAGIEPVADFAEVVERAGVYACDNSSTLFEFAALDRPVVVMNAPWYRREVEHGGRFWRWADVGEQVEGPGALGPAIVRAFDVDPQATRRREVVAEVLPHADGCAAERAADALLERYPAGAERPATLV